MICILITCSVLQAATVSEKKRTSIEQKITKNNKKIPKKKKEKRKTQHSLTQTKRNIRQTELSLANTTAQLHAALAHKRTLNTKLQETLQKKSTLKHDLKDRIRYLDKYPPPRFLDLFFNDSPWLLSTNSQYFFKHLLAADTALISSTLQTQTRLIKQQQATSKQASRINALQDLIRKQKQRLYSQEKKQQAHITALTQEINQLVKQNKELAILSAELSALIKKEQSSRIYYGSGLFIKPAKGWISSRYGLRKHPIFKRRIKHTGIDIAAPKGQPIYAAQAGKVIFAGVKGGYGKSVLIYHGFHPKTGHSLSTFYAHQSRLLVRKGDQVKKGDEIGRVGQTGYATGPHLHFEVKQNGTHVNPLKYINRQ